MVAAAVLDRGATTRHLQPEAVELFLQFLEYRLLILGVAVAAVLAEQEVMAAEETEVYIRHQQVRRLLEVTD